ncbi:MAG: PAS domain S-box protein [Gemmatimonadetes bacterium]|nr:PAS domain S-box protein [Gemmatimonadota bacterium]
MRDPEVLAHRPSADWETTGTPRVVRDRVAAYLALLALAAAASLAFRLVRFEFDPTVHVALEVLSVALAFFLGALALVRFYSRKNNVFLFLGTGFLATAFMDAFHTLESIPFEAIRLAGEPAAASAGTWVASRTVLALFFCLNWIGWRRERRLGQKGRIGEGAVYLLTALLTVATVAIVEFAPVPDPYHPDAIVPRVQDLVPAGLFLFALVGYLWKSHWKDNAFDHWLVVSLILGVVGEGWFMAFSTAPGDAYYAAAHALKPASYLCVMVGLLISVYSTFRQAEESAEALAREVVERERAQAELELRKAYLEKLFESAPEAIAVLDEEGRLTRMNDEFTRTFGYSREEALGARIEDLIVPADRIPEARTWKDRVTRGQTVGYEAIRQRRDGTTIDASILSTAIALEPERTAIYEIYRDISARKRAEEELHRAKEAAEEATRAKSEFLAHMSHELRTPLNSVIGFANVVLKGARDRLEDREAMFLERIRENGLHLLRLINDLLDLSKIEAGKMTVDPETVDVAGLVEDTVGQFRGQVIDRDLALETEIPRRMAPLTTDRGKLRQILINLIGNAVKFTEQGRVMVRVEVHPDTREPRRIEVEDTGIGIPPERLRRIFDAFEQGDTGTARSYGGTGLGLTISSQLCGLLGYDLTVSSEPGRGSTFAVVLTPPGGGGPELASSKEGARAARNGPSGGAIRARS